MSQSGTQPDSLTARLIIYWTKIVYEEEAIRLVKLFQVISDFPFPPVFILREIFQTLKDFAHGFIQTFQKKKKRQIISTWHMKTATAALILCWLLCSWKSFQAAIIHHNWVRKRFMGNKLMNGADTEEEVSRKKPNVLSNHQFKKASLYSLVEAWSVLLL